MRPLQYWVIFLGYLHQFDNENAAQLLMENRYTGEQEKVAKALFDNSCQYCHSPNTPLPFYSKFPIVGDQMQSDIQNGLRAFRLDRLVEGLKDPNKLSQADLAKLQRVLENNEMPIAKFRHLHWGSKPDEQEKVALQWADNLMNTWDSTAITLKIVVRH